MNRSAAGGSEKHPGRRARLLRSLVVLRHLPGWHRLSDWLAEREGEFEVDIAGARFAGNLSSFIEREAYLYGGYERDQIDLFLELVPQGGTILDVGANVGNHAVRFASHFEKVIAFEPNPTVIPKLERNAALNAGSTRGVIEVRGVGLGAQQGTFPLFNIENGNEGLATFSAIEQYDQKLEQVGTAEIAVADDLLGSIEVAAVKIDVQGYEPDVLAGMRGILERTRPVVWAEFGAGTLSRVGHRTGIDALFPYGIRLLRFVTDRRLGLNRTRLEEYTHESIIGGDYVAIPLRD